MSTANIHNNDIRSDLFDVLIRNTVIRIRVKKITEFITARHDHLTYFTAAFIKFKITDSSKFFAIPQIDHILGFQFRKTHIFLLSVSLSS